MATKTDLVNKILNQLNYLSKEDISDSVDLILEYLQEELAKEQRVEIRRFGSFSIRKRKFSQKQENQVSQSYKTIYYRMSKNID